ncbi:spermidine/putrescine ABC transporter ATP-binding protein [Candidatus Heimdallarchaeota archaeon B3_Heim]|nr:MAG: spermidine/putrescine ABC transporter ATP-binding protein [Candidatus Heimdallarchaeota archaeon B3_Heim]
MTTVKLENVTKRFGDFEAVKNVTIEAKGGEILTFLGPSGCGKSTTLRTIAGFNIPDTGKIYFDDREITRLSPQDRNTGMVFQNYALWPHMDVEENVEYGLKVRKVERELRHNRVVESLGMVKMDEYLDRTPLQLSGGQQQRVAVARALVINPDVLLLDEPLSNLDAKLRIETRKEIRSLVKELDLTAIFVTHDQSEALSISDSIAVMNEGEIIQHGSPRDIYEKPSSFFVASFIGEANELQGKFEKVSSDSSEVNVKGTDLNLKSSYSIEAVNGAPAYIAIRPEKVNVYREPKGQINEVKSKIVSIMYMGSFERIEVRFGRKKMTIHRYDIDELFKEGEEVMIQIEPINVMAFGR